jgi:hypothetical protein
LDVKVESMNIQNEDKRPMAFFQSLAPTENDVRIKHPEYLSTLGTYSLEIICRDLCNEPEEIMTEACFVYVRACLNIDRKPNPSGEMTFLPLDSPRLKVIWSSQKNYVKPYVVNALEIKFSHEVLTGEESFMKILKGDVNRQLKLVIDVQVGGTEGDSFPPIRTSYCCFSVYKLLEAAGYPRHDFNNTDPSAAVWSKQLLRNMVRIANLRSVDRSESEEEKPGMMTRMFGKKKPEDEEVPPPVKACRPITAASLAENEKGGVKAVNGKGTRKGSWYNILGKEKEGEKAGEVTVPVAPTPTGVATNDAADTAITLAGMTEEQKAQAAHAALLGDGLDGKRLSIVTLESARRNSITEVIAKKNLEKEREEERKRLQEEKDAEFDKEVSVKVVKRKAKRINPDFERELLSATTYRDPFLERMQQATMIKQVGLDILYLYIAA